jgi:transposase
LKKNFISVKDIAKDFDVSVATIYRWVRSGKLPPFNRPCEGGPAGYNRETYAKVLGVSQECLL